MASAATTTGKNIGALDPNVAVQSSRNLFKRGQYIAQGSVATRSVANMPLDPNSAVMAKTMADMSLDPKLPYAGSKGGWITTGVNWRGYNLPMYVVNSTKGCPTQYVKEERGVALQPYLTGQIPMPTYFRPADGGDSSAAIFDIGNGMNREYFDINKDDSTGGWSASYGGFSQTPDGLGTIGAVNPALQLPKVANNPGDPNTTYILGTSAVVGMHNSLMQIGFEELEDGAINHAVDFTFCEAGKGFSWPAQQGDGGYSGPGIAPVEGQWGRIDPSVDIEALNLNPVTAMIARAAQKYGIMGGDHNLYCHGFNFEHYVGDVANGIDPWQRIGAALGHPEWSSTDPKNAPSVSINDFPWHLTQWATKDWKGMDQAGLAPLPYLTYGPSWSYAKSGDIWSGASADCGNLAIRNIMAGNRGSASVQMYTKTVTAAKTVTLSAPVQVTSYGGAAQTISVYLDGSRTPVTSVKSSDPDAGRRLKFTLPAGSHTVRIQFNTPPMAQGVVIDHCWVGAFYAV